jgi:hypothetical protein
MIIVIPAAAYLSSSGKLFIYVSGTSYIYPLGQVIQTSKLTQEPLMKKGSYKPHTKTSRQYNRKWKMLLETEKSYKKKQNSRQNPPHGTPCVIYHQVMIIWVIKV